MTTPEAIFDAVLEEVGTVLVGNEEIVELQTISLLTRNHVLLEGVPGVAKTSIAKSFARATGLGFNRIQMTPDTLPADITGARVYQQDTGEFRIERGPVFTNVLLADEINRATPKTQSALLEAMQEQQVTLGGQTFTLPDPFMVVATQNPIEMEGVYELPEAQRDRFQFHVDVHLPDRETEDAILKRFDAEPRLTAESVSAVVTPEEIQQARAIVEDVYVDETVRDYILSIIERTRTSPDVEHGASPRGSLALLNAAKAHASLRGRDYVIPADVKSVATPLLVHRLVLNTDGRLSGLSTTDVVAEILESVETPSGSAEPSPQS